MTGFTLNDFNALLGQLATAPAAPERMMYVGYKLAWELRGKPRRARVKRRRLVHITFEPDYR